MVGNEEDAGCCSSGHWRSRAHGFKAKTTLLCVLVHLCVRVGVSVCLCPLWPPSPGCPGFPQRQLQAAAAGARSSDIWAGGGV